MAYSQITKKALAAAMKQLMAELPFEKISVADICERCGMNRKSFYYHFKDKYDLVNWIYDTEFIEAINRKSYATGWMFFEDICAYLDHNRCFYVNALHVAGQNSFSEYLGETLRSIFRRFFADLFLDDPNQDFYLSFFTDAVLMATVRWLTEHPEKPAAVFAAQIKTALASAAPKMIESLDKEIGPP